MMKARICSEIRSWRRLSMVARLIVVVTLGVGSVATNASLVAHWKFDESSGPTAHDSAGPYTGTLSTGGSAFVSGGISGNAISLDKAANGFVSMGDVLGLTSGDFSIVSWVKTAPGDTSETSYVVGKQASGYDNGYLLALSRSGVYGLPGKAFFYGSASPGQEVVSTTSVNDGSWHQIIGVYHAGGNALIYVDGTPAEASKLSRPIVANTVAFMIGGGSVGSSAPGGLFTGLIDDVQIYNYALSDSEIDFLFQHPGQVVLDCSQQLAAAQTQLAAANATNAVLQSQLTEANTANASLIAQLAAASATNASLTAQLAAAAATIATQQAQLVAAGNANSALQTQLATCNSALATANQLVQNLQDQVQDLLVPLQALTQAWRTTFRDPQFEIRGATSVEQLQNLVLEILELPRGEQQKLFMGLGGHKGKGHGNGAGP